MPQPLTDLLAQLEPEPWWQALKVLAGTFLLAFLVRWLLTRVVPLLTSRTRTAFDDQVIAYLKTPVFVSVLLFGCNLALALSELRDPGLRYTQAAEPKVCREPTPRVRFRAFEDSGIAVELLAWVPMPVDRGRAVDALICGVYERFVAEGIEIPFPQRVVHLRDDRAEPAERPSP
ncbi:MAG TPA: hypothetical protein VGG06_10515 [Thermoanaerobaculia bacterium]|jgi:hypothetical protein